MHALRLEHAEDHPNAPPSPHHGRTPTVTAATDRRLSIHARLKELVVDLASELVGLGAAQVDEALDEALRKVGILAAADRCVLYRFSDDGAWLTATHSWPPAPAAGPPPSRDPLAAASFELWVADLKQGREIYVTRADELPGVARRCLESLGGGEAASFALVPAIAGSRVPGFLGLFSDESKGCWTARDLRLLRSAAALLGAALRHCQAERALDTAESNLRTLLDGLDDYLFILDPAGRILHANPLAEQRLGRDLGELRTMTADAVIGPRERGARPGLLLERLKARPAIAHLVARDGSRVAVEIKLTEGLWSHHPVLYAVCRDISDREHTLARLRGFEERTRALLEAIPDAMLRLGRDGAIHDLTPGDLGIGIGASAGDELPRRIAAGCREAVDQALSSRRTTPLELELETASGPRTFEVRVVPMGDDEALAIVRDVSEQARLEQMKADFINRASHELRTPLTTALLMVDLIREGGEPDELAEYWRILRLELERQHELVEDLLTVGRLESGRMALHLAPTHPAPLLRSALAGAAKLAEARQVTLDPIVPDDLPQISADQSAMQRVLANLLDNALKFTPTGGRVGLAAAADQRELRIEVSDNGIGIPPEELSQLGERFFRASNAVRAEIQGTGVGLFIVRSIVEAHGGEVAIESTVDQGTTVTLHLPILDGGSADAP